MDTNDINEIKEFYVVLYTLEESYELQLLKLTPPEVVRKLVDGALIFNTAPKTGELILGINKLTEMLRGYDNKETVKCLDYLLSKVGHKISISRTDINGGHDRGTISVKQTDQSYDHGGN